MNVVCRGHLRIAGTRTQLDGPPDDNVASTATSVSRAVATRAMRRDDHREPGIVGPSVGAVALWSFSHPHPPPPGSSTRPAHCPSSRSARRPAVLRCQTGTKRRARLGRLAGHYGASGCRTQSVGSPRTTLGLWLDPPAARANRPTRRRPDGLGSGSRGRRLSNGCGSATPLPKDGGTAMAPSGSSRSPSPGPWPSPPVRLGFGVVPADSRLPSMLAKLTTSLDVISQRACRSRRAARRDNERRGDGDGHRSAARSAASMFSMTTPHLRRSLLPDRRCDQSAGSRSVRRDSGGCLRPSERRPVRERPPAALLPLVDGVVVEGDERTTARAAGHLEAAARSAGRGRPGAAYLGLPSARHRQRAMTRLVEDVRRQRAGGGDRRPRAHGRPSPPRRPWPRSPPAY